MLKKILKLFCMIGVHDWKYEVNTLKEYPFLLDAEPLIKKCQTCHKEIESDIRLGFDDRCILSNLLLKKICGWPG